MISIIGGPTVTTATTTTTTTTTAAGLFLVLVLMVSLQQQGCWVAGTRFAMKGPVLTVTLKDPSTSSATKLSSITDNDGGEVVSSLLQQDGGAGGGGGNDHPWIDLESLRPHLLWSAEVSSDDDDLNNYISSYSSASSSSSSSWMPSWWKSARATVGYDYVKLRRKPSFMEADINFRIPLKSATSNRRDAGGITRGGRSTGNALDLQIQPSYEFFGETALGGTDNGYTAVGSGGGRGGGRAECSILASTGKTAYLMAKFSTKRDRWLQVVRGCYQINFQNKNNGSSRTIQSYSTNPLLDSLAPPPLSAVRITPTIDLNRGQASCLVEATTGSERTKAALNLEYDNPTLTVVHSLDDRNTIAPQISLYNARILYQWDVALDSGTIRTKVDPMSSIEIKWTDRSMGGGKWVTDVRVPLVGTTLSQLAADLRVRRQFTF
eukprot:CAMPEP_0113501516 /NCGR_PEP_ID=MMETSP0014_2-20120614/33002_1 /TAXON_ID=2857 /ORGANISM="Nitzschia sp." /LENGTH=435 /DNA_ID=CAMNT_0000396121 /DNA_START=20 /DNA_END=1327 /DNA_ORIENTATION=+ /assembly_acc=CAM_ASM_000159